MADEALVAVHLLVQLPQWRGSLPLRLVSQPFPQSPSQLPYVLLLTSDLSLPQPDAVATLKRALDEAPRAALAGPRLVDEQGNDSLNGAFSFPSVRWMVLDHLGLARALGRARRPQPLAPNPAEAGPRPVPFVNGACMLVRREAFDVHPAVPLLVGETVCRADK